MSDNYALDLLGYLKQSESKKQINADIKQLEKVINKLRLTATFAKADTKRELNAYIAQLSNQLSTIKLKAKIDNKNLKSEINTALNNASFKDIDTLNIDENKTKLKVQKVIADTKAYVEKNPIVVGINISSKKSKLDNDLTTYLNRNSKISESRVLLEEANRVRDLIDAITDKKSLTEATDAFRLFKSEVSATGYTSKSTADKVKSMLGHITKIGSAFGMASIAVNNFVKSIKTLRSNDIILTETSKTSEMTKQQLKELGDEAFKIAGKYGQLSSNYLLAVQEMARSGYEDTSKQLGELSLLTQSAGDMTAENANNYLLATDAAYKYSGSIEKLNEALDGANYISNRNSASLTDIADATRVSASFAANAGVAIDELTAAEATMIATTKRSGSEIGRAFRSIVLNLQQVSGEFDGEVIDEEQLKKVEERCHSLGVELEYMKDGIATLRNPIEVLKDLAEVYNSLPDNSAEKQGLISDLGGKYHANALSALLSRWDLYEKMLSEFSQGTGSALEEAEKTANSWEGRLNSLQNSWDSFINTLTNKEAVMGGISFFDRLIQEAEKLTDAIGEIPVVLTTLNTAMVALKKDYGITQLVNPETKKLDLQGSMFGIDFSAIKEQKKHFEEASKAISGWNSKLSQGQVDISDFENALVQNNAQLKSYLSTCSKDAPASLSGYKAYLNAAGVSTDALRLKTILLNSAISMGIGVAIEIAMKGISLLVNKVDEMAHASEYCAERVDELMSNYQSALDKANSNAKTVEDLASRYEELSKGVNNLGQNVSLTADEYSEYNDIVNQIADMFPTMVQGYTNEGNAILSLKGNVEQLREAYKEAQQEAYNMLIISGEDSDGNDIIENYHNKISNDNPFVKPDSTAQEYIDIINSFHEAMLTSDEAYNRLYEEMIKNQQLINEYDMSAKQFTKIKKVLDDIGFKSELSDDDKRAINNSVKSYTQTYQAEIDNALQGVQSLANAYLMTNDDYAELDDDAKTAASLIVNSIDTELANGFEEKTDVGAYVAKIVSLIKDNPDVSNALNGLFNTDFSDLSYDDAKAIIDQYINDIVKSTGHDPVELKATLGFSEYDDNENLVNNVKEKLQDEFDDKAGELTLKDLEIAANLDIPEGVFLSWDELIAKIEEVKEQLANQPLSISDTIDQLNTRLKPALDSLKSAYQDLFNDDGKFDLDSVDILSTCDTIKSKLDELNNIEGITVDYSSYEDFVRVLRDSESTEQDVEIAMNSLASSITKAALSGAEDFETMKAALEDLGVVNSEMVAFDTLTGNTEALDEAFSQANVSMDDFIVNAKEGTVEATKAGNAFLEEKVGAENCAEALTILGFKKELCNLQEMNTAGEVANLKTLAENAGYTGEVIQYLTELEQIYQEVASGTLTKEQILVKTGRAAVLKTLIDSAASKVQYTPKMDWSGAAKDASKAGSKAADAYLEAFEKELKDLQSLRDQGVISEVEYLRRLRALYSRYFKDRKEYLDEFKKYESEYLSGMLELHNKALSGISTLLNRKISVANDSKEASISALEEEKEAAEEAYQAQIDAIEKEKDAIDDLIKEKNKKIDSINEEIEAIEKAAETRKKNIDLQQQEYNLEKLLNQRTILQYSSDKGMHYVTDTKAISDAREKVKEAKESLEIDRLKNEADLIQKEIDLLEEKKEALSEEQEVIQKLIDESNKYYDNLIKEQEKYWDSMIKNMEQQKSKWEELAEIEEIAQAYSAIEQVFGELGYSVEDILNGSESAFEDFKSRYIAIMSDMNQNTSFQEGLEYASGVAKENFGSIVSDAQNAAQELSDTFSDGSFAQAVTQGVSDGIVSAKQELDNMGQLGRDAGDGLINGWDEKVSTFIEAVKQAAINAVEAFAEGQDSHSPSEAYKAKAGDAIDGLLLGIEENKQAFIDTVRSLAEEGVLAFEEGFNFENSTINASFDSLKLLIESVTEALGIGTEGTAGLLGALDQLSKFTFSEDSIVKQFTNLKTAIDSVTSAISGGGESSGGEDQGSSGSVKGGKPGGKGTGGEGGADSLTGAINEIGSTAGKVIGKPEAEGDGTVIGEFGSMKTAVNDVTTAIGSGESEDGEGKGSEDEGNLIESITNLGTTTKETLGESGGDGVIGRFEEFKNVIGEANEHVTGISDGLAKIDKQKVECTIKVNIEKNGDFPMHAEGTLGTNMNLESGEYTAQYGKAFAEGTGKYKGLPKDEKNALVSEYGQTEMTVLPDGNTIITDEPTMMDLPKDTVIYNEAQTKKIMDNKVNASGNAHADGTIVTPDGKILIPYNPTNDDSNFGKLYKAWHGYYDNIDKNVEDISRHLAVEQNQKMNKEVDQFINSTSSVVNNNKNVQQPVTVHQNITLNCPNLTNNSGVEYVQQKLGNLSLKATQMPLNKNW